MKLSRLFALLSVPVLLWSLVNHSVAGHEFNIVVKTILASDGPRYVDSRLSTLVKSLESLFRYSRYQLLDQHSMSLSIAETGIAHLPGGRILKVTPIRTIGNRVRLQLAIEKEGQQMFETVIELMNLGTITVGGPEDQQGYLLFNIFSSF
jgi:hypothetical protein